MPSDRLSPLDVTFLHVEDDVTHMSIGSVGRFEGPAPAHEEVLDALRTRLHLAPRYRQKVRFVPLSAGRPVWVDDPDFDLDYHVRRTALAPPGSDDELRRVLARVMALQLDRDRPLWELWVVEGLEDGCWALISKLHHAMVDGVSASNLITSLMDTERSIPTPAPVPWEPAPAPTGAQLVTDALAERARWPLRGVGRAAAAARDPRGLARRTGETLRGLSAYGGLLRPPNRTGLNGGIGGPRRWAFARVRLTDVKAIRTAFGGTVNDVVLAAIAGGFRDLLESRGDPVDRPVRTMVPVSVRTTDAAGVPDNRVSAMFADLPVHVEDPAERLRVVRRHLEQIKASHEAEAGEILTSLAGFAPEVLLSAGERLARRVPQRSVNTVTTNVPGPQVPLFFCGRRMLEVFPYVPLGGHVRVGVAIYSYDGTLGFGVTGDWDTAPDVAILCRGIERSMAAMLDAATARNETMAARAPEPSRGSPS